MARNANGTAPGDASDEFILPEFFVNDVQDFPIEFVLSGKAKTLDLPGDDNFRFLSPGLKATLTNLDDPTNSVTLNVTGSITTTELEDGSVVTVYTGHNLVIDPFIAGGGPGLVLIKGRFSTIEDAEGNLEQPLEGTGQVIDVIGLLD